ncbi:MAG: AAA family ATPase [Candidatus Saccharimonas sp.]
MVSRLIIIRGNSGSGKTTIAKRLQREMGYGTMLVPQDVIRREIVRVEDGHADTNPSTELIKRTVLYAQEIEYDVILEGILSNKNYRPMLDTLIDAFNGHIYVYYFLLPFEETVRRHATKRNAHEFNEDDMRAWWRDDDRLGLTHEVIFDHTHDEDYIIAKILKDIDED